MTRCLGNRRDGGRCTRMTRIHHGYCWQHEDQAAGQPRQPEVILLNNYVPMRRNNRSALRQLANDNQNVHDRRLTSTMQPMMRRLLATPVPRGQDTLAIVETRLREYYGQTHRRTWLEWLCCLPTMLLHLAPENLRVYHHIRDLYAPHINDGQWSVAAFGNRSFRQVLDHATAFIERSRTPADIWARVFIEMRDGIGYCLHGNMARLLNAFGGFYDDATVVDTSALLQSRMAAIAAKTDSVETKLTEARVILHELQIPETQWAPWLEALEE